MVTGGVPGAQSLSSVRSTVADRVLPDALVPDSLTENSSLRDKVPLSAALHGCEELGIGLRVLELVDHEFDRGNIVHVVEQFA